MTLINLQAGFVSILAEGEGLGFIKFMQGEILHLISLFIIYLIN